MTDRTDTTDRIDNDRSEGSMKQMKGGVKETAGNFVGDEKMRREGQAEKSEGKLQNAWGSVKDKAAELTGGDRKDERR